MLKIVCIAVETVLLCVLLSWLHYEPVRFYTERLANEVKIEGDEHGYYFMRRGLCLYHLDRDLADKDWRMAGHFRRKGLTAFFCDEAKGENHFPDSKDIERDLSLIFDRRTFTLSDYYDSLDENNIRQVAPEELYPCWFSYPVSSTQLLITLAITQSLIILGLAYEEQATSSRTAWQGPFLAAIAVSILLYAAIEYVRNQLVAGLPDSLI